MRSFNILMGFFLLFCIGILGCEQQKQSVPADGGELGGGFEIPSAPSPEYRAKETVSGCTGGSGTVPAAKQAFLVGDFTRCNEEASCAYNASVETDPKQPDQYAAFYGFLCKLALQVETPEAEYLVLEKLNASDYFMSGGSLSGLGDLISAKFAGNGLTFAKNFFTAHQTAGHSVEEVVVKVADFVLGFEDLRILAKAMARPPIFEDAIPVEYFNEGEVLKVSYVEAGIIYNLIANLQAVAELAKLYRVGIDSPDSFNTPQELVNDMNATPKFLSLRASAPSTDNLRARLKEAIRSWNLSAANVTAQDFDTTKGEYTVEKWVRELYPLHGKAEPLIFMQLFQQVGRSLEGKFVWLSASEYGASVNADVFLKNPPNSDNLAAVSLVKLDPSSDLELDEDGMKAFAADFIRLNAP